MSEATIVSLIIAVVGSLFGGGVAGLIVGLILMRLEKRNIKYSQELGARSQMFIHFNDITTNAVLVLQRAKSTRMFEPTITSAQRSELEDMEATLISSLYTVALYFKVDSKIEELSNDFFLAFLSDSRSTPCGRI